MQSILPGILISFLLAIIAKILEFFLATHIIGAPVIALFLGIAISHIWCLPHSIKLGATFTSKRLLKVAIILLGASLNIAVLVDVGQMSLIVMVFTLLTCFCGGYFIGKLLGINWKLSSLISSGVGICGGSAIAAVAPVIDADDSDVAYAMSGTFIFGIMTIVLFPIIGREIGLSDIAYGLWAGTAVNDTSSVVAAGYAYSQQAGDFAVMVKLTRILAIIPTVILFAFIHVRQIRQKNGETKTFKISVLKLFPWFLLGFLVLTVLNSSGIIPSSWSLLLKDLSKFMMIMSLGAIGLNTNLKKMIKTGVKPFVHGLIISIFVAIVALLSAYAIGIS